MVDQVQLLQPELGPLIHTRDILRLVVGSLQKGTPV